MSVRATRIVLAFAAGSCALTPAAHACPSYTLSSASNDHGCAVEAAAGQEPEVPAWSALLEKIALGPSAWRALGPKGVDIEQGCGSKRKVSARMPCEVLKAVAMNETRWTHFCAPSSPPDQKGKQPQTVISRDCGYGIMQVTSGMRRGEQSEFDVARVAGDPAYSAAVGATILARKWQRTPCVGARSPDVIEHWYYALWAYNGLAYKNFPGHPNYDPDRGVYNPKVDPGGAYPYQEKVFGWIEHPPDARWPAIALAYPRLETIPPQANAPLGEPECASPSDCSQRRKPHRTRCVAPDPDAPAAETTPAPTPPNPPAAQPTPSAPPAPPDAQPTADERSRWGCSAGLGAAGLIFVALLLALRAKQRRS